jgi:hypothetical protein
MLLPGRWRLGYAHGMARYFFDTRDNSHSLRDELGLELDSLEEARDEATRGLADLAKDVLPSAVRRELAVEVRDEIDFPVLRAALWLEVAVVAAL